MATFSPPKYAEPVVDQPHPNEVPLIDEIVNRFCAWRGNLNAPNAKSLRKLLESMVYQFYTVNFLTRPYIDRLLRGEDPAGVQWLEGWYPEYTRLESEIDRSGKNLGYRLAENPMWRSYIKPSKALPTRINYKAYLTITHGLDEEKLLKNMYQLNQLLDNVSVAKTTGQVAVKRAVPLVNLLSVKDTVVIHFSDQHDAPAIAEAIRYSGLDLYKRDKLHRLNWGYDINGSDTERTAEYFVDYAKGNRAIQSQMCPPHQLTSADRKQVFDALMAAMQGAAHRQGISVF